MSTHETPDKTGATRLGADRRRILIALLLAASGLLFFVGTRIEAHTGGRQEQGGHVEHPAESGGGHEQSEGGAPSHVEGETTSEPTAEAGHSESSEKVLGLNLESLPFAIAVTAISILLAVLVAFTASRAVIVAVVGISAGAAVFDVLEVVHQLDQSKPSLAVVAALVLALHTTITALGTRALAAPGGHAGPSPSAATS